MIDVVVRPGSFFFPCLFFRFPNYNAFFYLFKLQTYYYHEILLLQVENEPHWGQTMTDVVVRKQVSFFSSLFFSFLFSTSYDAFF